MVGFSLRMTTLAAARKLYRMVILITLLLYHYVYMCVQPCEVGVHGSTFIFALFFGFADVDKWLHRLHEEWKTFAILGLSAVVFALTPRLFTLAVSVAFILLAALFYPSKRMLSLWKDSNDRKLFTDNTAALTRLYY